MEKKPCPFCGERRQDMLYEAGHCARGSRYVARIECVTCGNKSDWIIGNTSIRDAIQQSIEAWNKRV